MEGKYIPRGVTGAEVLWLLLLPTSAKDIDWTSSFLQLLTDV